MQEGVVIAKIQVQHWVNIISNDLIERTQKHGEEKIAAP